MLTIKLVRETHVGEERPGSGKLWLSHLRLAEQPLMTLKACCWVISHGRRYSVMYYHSTDGFMLAGPTNTMGDLESVQSQNPGML